MSVFQRMPADPLMHILLDGRPLDWYGLSATDGVLAIEAPDLAVAYQNAPGMAGSHDVTLDDPLGCAYPGLRRIALGVVTVGEDDEMMDARRRQLRARTRMDDLTCSTSSTGGATRNPPP